MSAGAVVVAEDMAASFRGGAGPVRNVRAAACTLINLGEELIRTEVGPRWRTRGEAGAGEEETDGRNPVRGFR
ncbi:hypothetical protein GCM10010498_20820 [Streptomyces cavourensis]|nr:hypothetical protein GCM10010498_20820 [Streptomyces cavourensis]